jgi:hypothetical protein
MKTFFSEYVTFSSSFLFIEQRSTKESTRHPLPQKIGNKHFRECSQGVLMQGNFYNFTVRVCSILHFVTIL